MTAKRPTAKKATTPALSEAIAKNLEATVAVQQVADDLGVVHAVLIKEVAENAGEGDGARAIQRTAVLEQKLNDTAEKMVEVSKALARQHGSLEHLNKAK
jgi:galactitol-specific phosphotransferase system IIB component